MNLPKIDRPLTATQLRDRVLAQMNGEARELSQTDQERRKRVLAEAVLVVRARRGSS